MPVLSQQDGHFAVLIQISHLYRLKKFYNYDCFRENLHTFAPSKGRL